jgi:uncharacterized protein (DUF736 family)
MPAIDFVTKQKDGAYKGELKTLTICTPIEIRPNRRKSDNRHPDFLVYAANSVEIGTARKRIGRVSEVEYIAVTIATPEIGLRTLEVNLGRAADQDDPNVLAIMWNPED